MRCGVENGHSDPLSNSPGAAATDGQKSLLFSFAVAETGWRAEANESTAWTWEIYALADARSKRAIEVRLDLPPPVRESLLTSELHFGLEYEDGWLHGSVPDLIHENYAISDTLGHMRIALSDGKLVCARKKPLQNLDAIRLAFEQKRLPLTAPQHALDRLVQALCASLGRQISEIALNLDSIEVHIVGEEWGSERERLSDVRRRAVVINRHIGSINGVFRNILQSQQQHLPGELRELFQAIVQRNADLHHDIDQVQARARLLQDEVMARLSERSNNLLSIISVMTAVMLPATIVTGMFGMNTPGLPFSGNPNGFWFATLVAIVLAGLFYILVRHLTRRF
jgi:zinc transporter